MTTRQPLHIIIDIVVLAWLGESYKNIAESLGYQSPNYVALVARRFGIKRRSSKHYFVVNPHRRGRRCKNDAT